MDKEVFYKRLENIAREVFGDFCVNLAGMEPDIIGRGGSPDDIVYVLSEISKKNVRDGEWDVLRSLFAVKAVKAAINLYFEEHTELERQDISVNIEGSRLFISRYNEYHQFEEDNRSAGITFEIARLDKDHMDPETLLPRFLTNEFKESDYTISEIEYKDDEVKITYKRNL